MYEKKSSICFKYLRGFRVNRGEDKVIAVHYLSLYDKALSVHTFLYARWSHIGCEIANCCGGLWPIFHCIFLVGLPNWHTSLSKWVGEPNYHFGKWPILPWWKKRNTRSKNTSIHICLYTVHWIVIWFTSVFLHLKQNWLSVDRS